jgi:hypothetical protein
MKLPFRLNYVEDENKIILHFQNDTNTNAGDNNNHPGHFKQNFREFFYQLVWV